MKKIVLSVLLCFCFSAMIYAQTPNSKQRMTFKSIVIQNGDTVVTEKNIESDDPNAQLSDSIPMQNGMFRFSFGDKNADQFFNDFGNFNDPLSSVFQNPFMSDSLLNRLINPHYTLDSNGFFQNPGFRNPSFEQNQGMPHQNFNKDEEEANKVSSFKVAILPEINKINITFKLSPQFPSMISVEDKQGRPAFAEQVEASEGYFVRQIDLEKLKAGKYTVKLVQGGKIETENILISQK
jgi:hypothetical protein